MEQDKEYTTGQMIDMLMENPRRRAIAVSVSGDEEGEAYFEAGNLLWDGAVFTIGLHNHNWRIIEQERVDFIRAFKAYQKQLNIVSCVTNRIFLLGGGQEVSLLTATDEELQGKWIILD